MKTIFVRVTLLVSLFGCLAMHQLAAVTFHNNMVYLNFFDKNNNPLNIEAGTFVLVNQQVTSGQAPDPIQDPQFSNAGTQLVFCYYVGRHRSSQVADSFQTTLEGPNGLPNVLTLGINDNDNTYYCQDMNFWFKGTLKHLQISDSEYISIPNIVLGQSSNSFWKIFLASFEAIGATIWDGFKTVTDALDGNEFGTLIDGFKTLKDGITGAQSISASCDNFWLISQSIENYDGSNLDFGASGAIGEEDVNIGELQDLFAPNPFSPPSLPSNTYPLVVTGVYQNTSTNQSYIIPILISAGSNDHSFNINLPYPFTVNSSASAESDDEAASPPDLFADAPQVVDNYFTDPSIGIFEKQPNTTWIYSLLLGWCYPSGNYEPELWLFNAKEQDWFFVNKDMPGWFYKERTSAWYYYDPVSVRHYLNFTLTED